MSRVYFHSQHGTAELLGSERAHCGGLVEDIAVGMLPDFPDGFDEIAPLIHPSHYLHGMNRDARGFALWRESFLTAWRIEIGSTSLLTWHGHDLSAWNMSLNTAMAVGNDPIKLAARLHAQCEIHAWVDGINRWWLADIIGTGRRLGVYRADAGWEEVAALLRDRDDEPVVTSYSVCDGFPNPAAAGWEPPPMPEGWRHDYYDEAEWASLDDEKRRDIYTDSAYDLWGDMPDAEQWRLAMAGLHATPGMLELTPATWSGSHFGRGLTVFDLLAVDRDERFRRALEPVNANGDTA